MLKPKSVNYDSDRDALYVVVREGTISHSFELTPEIVLDLDDDQNVIGVDIMPFSAIFPIFPTLPDKLHPMRQEWVPA